MSRARFDVLAKLDGPRLQRGTVTIERKSVLFQVRPFKRRRVYELPLGDVAAMVVQRIIKSEVAAMRAERMAKRRRRC